MAISERINPDQLNIHQFQETPEGKSELPFDPDRDISNEYREKLWAPIRDGLSSFRDTAMFEAVWPEYHAVYTYEKMIHVLDNYKSKFEQDDSLVNIAHYVEMLSLALRCGHKIAISDDDKELTREFIGDIILESKLIGNTENIMIAKFIMPDEVNLSEDQLVGAIEKSKDKLPFYVLARFRLFNPNFKPVMSEHWWLQMKNSVHDESTRINDIFYMKILAAHKVEITKPGVIEFQMYPPEDMGSKTPPVPETRKF